MHKQLWLSLFFIQVGVLNYFFLIEFHITFFFFSALLFIINIKINLLQTKYLLNWVGYFWVGYFWVLCFVNFSFAGDFILSYFTTIWNFCIMFLNN